MMNDISKSGINERGQGGVCFVFPMSTAFLKQSKLRQQKERMIQHPLCTKLLLIIVIRIILVPPMVNRR